MDIASTQQIESKVSRITETYTDANDIDNSSKLFSSFQTYYHQLYLEIKYSKIPQ